MDYGFMVRVKVAVTEMIAARVTIRLYRHLRSTIRGLKLQKDKKSSKMR